MTAGQAHPSMDIGYNNPSKLNDSIYSDGSQYLHGPGGPGGHNDSVMAPQPATQSAIQQMVTTDAFSQMTQQKYLFPSDQITNRDWFVELQRPLNITVADIKRDFTKFIKDFPMDIIPHTSDEELAERNAKHKTNMRAAIRRDSKRLNSIVGNNHGPNRQSNVDLPSVAGGGGTIASAVKQNLRTSQSQAGNKGATRPKHFSNALHYATA